MREFLVQHEVRTVTEMEWPPQIENGELLRAAEQAGFDVLLTSDQNIQHQQVLSKRKLAFVILGSNIWPVVRNYAAAIADAVDEATPGVCRIVEMKLPKKPQKSSRKQ